MRKSWLVVAFIGLAACKPVPPVIVPTPPPPTPTPGPPDLSALHLTTSPEGRFIRASDPTYKTRKCISCCRDTKGTGWPGASKSWVDFARGNLCNMIHWRVGPFRPCNEPEYKEIGGVYVEVAGKADLTKMNDAYFTALHDTCEYAGTLGMNCEVSLLDGWSAKTESWCSTGSPGETCTPCWHPWSPGGNVQGEDHLSTSWKGAILDPVQLALLQRTLAATLDLPNVIYEAGTETDQLIKKWGLTAEDIVTRELTFLAILRQSEAAAGVPPHLFGTNFVGDASYAWLREGSFQYQNAHPPIASRRQPFPVIAVEWWDTADPKRPLMNDEYNPDPPMRAEDVRAFSCFAEANGSYFALWRHDMLPNEWQAALSLTAGDFLNGCPENMKTGCAYDVPPVSRIDCKVHAYPLYDCTPKGPSGQPILPEGNISRALCERRAAGLKPAQGPEWSCSNPQIGVNPRPNIFQFTIDGPSGSFGALRCKIPATGETDICGGYTLQVR